MDFLSQKVIAIHLGAKPSFAYSVSIESVSYDSRDGTMQVRYIQKIDTSLVWPEAISYPYILIRVHNDPYEYRFIQLDNVVK